MKKKFEPLLLPQESRELAENIYIDIKEQDAESWEFPQSILGQAIDSDTEVERLRMIAKLAQQMEDTSVAIASQLFV